MSRLRYPPLVRQWWPLWVFALVLQACGEDLSDCDEVHCRQAKIEAVFESAPAQLPEMLRDVTDPIEQLALVRRFVDRGGSDLEVLCSHVPSELVSLGHECGRMLVRPHLRTAPVQRGAKPEPLVSRPRNGPAWPSLKPDEPLPNTWAQMTPLFAECGAESLRDACQHQAALNAAERGDATAVAAACLGVSKGRWREECFFDAVKSMTRSWVSDRIGGAVRLCAATNPNWVDLCLERAITNRNGEAHAAQIPPLDMPTDPRWDQMQRRAAAAQSALQEWNPELADAAVSRFWARVAGRSAAKTKTLPKGDLAHWSRRQRPHVRAAVAWQAWVRQSPNLAKIDAMPPGIHGWVHDRAGEEQIAAVHYFYGDRRALAADPAVDALVCHLEAVARFAQGEIGRDVLIEAVSHKEAVVRWTAARLLERLAHPDSVPPGASGEPNPGDIARAAEWKMSRAQAAAELVIDQRIKR